MFDDNGISIDGPTTLTESTDVPKRFEAAGWHVAAIDGHDPDAIAAAIEAAQAEERPSLIACRTEIGKGAPTKAGTSGVHGAPLGSKETAGLRRAMGLEDYDPFAVESDIRDAWRIAGLRSGHARKDWEGRRCELDPELRAEFDRCVRGDLPSDFAEAMFHIRTHFANEAPAIATRAASERVLQEIAGTLPEAIGGSADLTGSNNTRAADMAAVTADDFSGRYIHFGVREHAMAAIMNGMALHRGVIPYGGTFLVFSDYCRPAMRLSAMMGLRVIYVMTHDSIGLGEDGPTHQPVEHLAALRAIPGLNVFRPADAVETAECWQLALETGDAPSVLALSRQAVPALRTTYEEKNFCARGAYEIAAADDDAEVSIFATGSEVSIALAAKALLDQAGHPTRVVSIPCFERFAAQSDDYREEIVGSAPVRIAVEAALRLGWDAIIGNGGVFIGMTGFGASAPAKALYQHFGITAETVADAALKRLQTDG